MGRLVSACFVSCAPERGTSGTLQLTRRPTAKETISCWSAFVVVDRAALPTR